MIKIIEELGKVDWDGKNLNTVIVQCEDCDFTRKIIKTKLKNKLVYRCKTCSCRINGLKGMKKIREQAAIDRLNPEIIEKRKENRRITHRRATKKYRLKNKDKIEDYHYITNYGMTKSEAILFKKQGCFICQSRKRLVIDHDHQTGLVRGVLCDNHNKGLGLLGDTYEDVILTLEKLKIYLNN